VESVIHRYRAVLFLKNRHRTDPFCNWIERLFSAEWDVAIYHWDNILQGERIRNYLTKTYNCDDDCDNDSSSSSTSASSCTASKPTITQRCYVFVRGINVPIKQLQTILAARAFANKRTSTRTTARIVPRPVFTTQKFVAEDGDYCCRYSPDAELRKETRACSKTQRNATQ